MGGQRYRELRIENEETNKDASDHSVLRLEHVLEVTEKKNRKEGDVASADEIDELGVGERSVFLEGARRPKQP